jgi:hypothetical protein
LLAMFAALKYLKTRRTQSAASTAATVECKIAAACSFAAHAEVLQHAEQQR